MSWQGYVVALVRQHPCIKSLEEFYLPPRKERPQKAMGRKEEVKAKKKKITADGGKLLHFPFTGHVLPQIKL